MAWSMVLGPAAKKPQVVEREIRQIDMAPSIGRWLGLEVEKSAGSLIPELNV
jgi:hypothetical protein